MIVCGENLWHKFKHVAKMVYGQHLHQFSSRGRGVGHLFVSDCGIRALIL